MDWHRFPCTGRLFHTTGAVRAPFTLVEIEPTAWTIEVAITGRRRRIPIRELDAAWQAARQGQPIHPAALRRAGISEANPAYVAATVRTLLSSDCRAGGVR